MKKYNERTTCPKCGGAFVSTRYVKNEHGTDTGKIKRNCARCGYSWFEATLDDCNPDEIDEIVNGKFGDDKK